MSDNIYVDPGTGGSKVLVGTRTLTVNSVANVEVPYGILGYESSNTLVAVDATHGLPVSVLNTSIAVTAAALPLPSGAATESTLSTLNGKVTACNTGAVVLAAGSAVIGHVVVDTAPTTTVTGTVLVGNFPSGFLSAQSGSWTVTANAGSGTFAVSAASLPLPTGASTEATLSTLNGKVTAVNTGAVVLAAGSAVIGHVVVDTAPTTAVTGTFWQSVQPVTQTPATSGGDSVYSVISSGAANQDAASVKGSAGQIYGYACFNTTASARFVKLYNVSSPTSASTPILRIYLPPTGGANLAIPDGIACGTAIGIRITTGAADNDTGACSSNDVMANVTYK
jgi:hypothetical protein